jgi:hypothetical protein
MRVDADRFPAEELAEGRDTLLTDVAEILTYPKTRGTSGGQVIGTPSVVWTGPCRVIAERVPVETAQGGRPQVVTQWRILLPLEAGEYVLPARKIRVSGVVYDLQEDDAGKSDGVFLNVTVKRAA